MSEGRPVPAETDFTKTLMIVLLAEYLCVIAARAMGLAFASASSPVFTTAIRLAAFLLFLQVLAMSLVTMLSAAGMRADPAHAALARTSFAMCAGHAALLTASYLSANLAFHAIAAALTAVAIAVVLVAVPGKFLRPSS